MPSRIGTESNCILLESYKWALFNGVTVLKFRVDFGKIEYGAEYEWNWNYISGISFIFFVPEI